MGDDVRIAAAELERLRRIEAAATQVIRRWEGKKTSATPMLQAIAELRASLKAGPA